jgi:adenylate cyclase
LHGLLIGQGWSEDRTRDLDAVNQMAQQALFLGGDNVRALVYNAHWWSLYYRDYDVALRMFQHAPDVSPSSAHAWLKSSYTFAYGNIVGAR